MTHAERSAATRQRLLDAAAHVFAEDGFRSATIQRICRRANANIAAVHYHFGDKNGLYASVFEYAAEVAARDAPPETANGTPPQAQLRAHVTSMLTRLLDPHRPAWLARLIAREMIEPTPALDSLVRRRMRANHAHLAGIIRQLLGPAASKATVRLCTLSVVSQCVFYRNSAPIIARLYPELVGAKEVARIADHVTTFSLAAIRGLRRAVPSEGKRHD